jgi:hypothetical protein
MIESIKIETHAEPDIAKIIPAARSPSRMRLPTGNRWMRANGLHHDMPLN